MTVADDVAAAAAVLDGFVPIAADDPRTAEFEAGMRQMAAERAVAPPESPQRPLQSPESGLLVIAGQLTTIIHQNAAVIELLGAIGHALEAPESSPESFDSATLFANTNAAARQRASENP